MPSPHIFGNPSNNTFGKQLPERMKRIEKICMAGGGNSGCANGSVAASPRVAAEIDGGGTGDGGVVLGAADGGMYR